MTAIAVIPARGGSKRIPRKNIVPVGGKPMLAWPVETALASGLFARVIVSTEDPEIAGIARDHGAEVIDRPLELATDTAFEIDVYRQVLDEVKKENGGKDPEYFVGIYPTAILITPEDLRGGFTALEDGAGADVVMSVCEYPIHPYKALQADENDYLSMVYPVECKQRSQTYPRRVASNGTFYWFRTAHYREDPQYYTRRLRPYILPPDRAVDIDEPKDLAIAEMYLKIKQGQVCAGSVIRW